jgi:hypothetical protein
MNASIAVVATSTFATGRTRPGVNVGPVFDAIGEIGCGYELYVETAAEWKHGENIQKTSPMARLNHPAFSAATDRNAWAQASHGQISRRWVKLKIPVAWLSENWIWIA